MAEKANTVRPDGKDEPRKCKVCKITCPDIYAYSDHLESKEHIKGVMKNKYGPKYLEAKAKLDGKSPPESPKIDEEPPKFSKETPKIVEGTPKTPKEISKNPDAKFEIVEKSSRSSASSLSNNSKSSSEDSDEDGEVYPCEVCKKVCTGFLSYQLHLEGRKHSKNVKKSALLKKMKEQKLIPEFSEDDPKQDSLLNRLIPPSQRASIMECKTCKKKCTGPEAFKQHCKSASHQKKVALEGILKDMETEGHPLSAKEDDENNSFAHCDICMKSFSGPLPYMQHMESITHLKQERYQQQLGKIKDLIISEEEETKFKCKECGKMFSGPIPFNAHLKSSAHGKMEKKNTLLDKLEKQHPEMIKTTTTENSDDSDEEESMVLGCKVCHMVFSGPEAAKDHFSSTKHKKAVKKKEMFKKFKQQQKEGKLLLSSGGERDKKKVKNSKEHGSSDSSDFEDEFDIISQA